MKLASLFSIQFIIPNTLLAFLKWIHTVSTPSFSCLPLFQDFFLYWSLLIPLVCKSNYDFWHQCASQLFMLNYICHLISTSLMCRDPFGAFYSPLLFCYLSKQFRIISKLGYFTSHTLFQIICYNLSRSYVKKHWSWDITAGIPLVESLHWLLSMLTSLWWVTIKSRCCLLAHSYPHVY